MTRIRLLTFLVGLLLSPMTRGDTPTLADAKKSEQERVELIRKITPTAVAIFGRGGGGGGSGVLIDEEGYALTNWHVVNPTGPVMLCGLSDGIAYEAVLVGQDKVGDLALIKLLPKKPGQKFPFSPLADSDKVKVGDWTLALGNPFILATDFTPTVSFGLVTGTHRYQPPSRGILEYTDCIQTDTPINPGNSGGPLFNMNGEVIGINGRISFAVEKRFRINSGVGYAISSNQVKNFLGHLRSGLEVDHATLGAIVDFGSEEDGEATILQFTQTLEGSDISRRGVTEGDELVSIFGRPISTSNQFLNVLGIFPYDWRIPLTYRRKNTKREILVRLPANLGKEPEMPMVGGPPMQPIQPLPKDSPATKMYIAKKGYANWYFNQERQKELFAGFLKTGDFSKQRGNWRIEGNYESPNLKGDFRIEILSTFVEGRRDPKILVRSKMILEDELDPLKPNQPEPDLLKPSTSGGLLMAIYHYHRLLTMGAAGFERECAHGGVEPIYPFPIDGSEPKSLLGLRRDCEVLRTEHAAVTGKWFFEPTTKQLQAFEISLGKDSDPCEVYLHDYAPVGPAGMQLPKTIEVRHADTRFAFFRNIRYTIQ